MILFICMVITYIVLPDYLYVPVWLLIGVLFFLFKSEDEDI